MAKKTPKQLDDEIDRFLRGEIKGPRELAPPPRYDAKREAWIGGDTRTLYAFTVPATGQTVVRPGGGVSKSTVINAGRDTRVRIATLAEAEELWQKPLHAAWNVRP